MLAGNNNKDRQTGTLLLEQREISSEMGLVEADKYAYFGIKTKIKSTENDKGIQGIEYKNNF